MTGEYVLAPTQEIAMARARYITTVSGRYTPAGDGRSLTAAGAAWDEVLHALDQDRFRLYVPLPPMSVPQIRVAISKLIGTGWPDRVRFVRSFSEDLYRFRVDGLAVEDGPGTARAPDDPPGPSPDGTLAAWWSANVDRPAVEGRGRVFVVAHAERASRHVWDAPQSAWVDAPYPTVRDRPLVPLAACPDAVIDELRDQIDRGVGPVFSGSRLDSLVDWLAGHGWTLARLEQGDGS